MLLELQKVTDSSESSGCGTDDERENVTVARVSRAWKDQGEERLLQCLAKSAFPKMLPVWNIIGIPERGSRRAVYQPRNTAVENTSDAAERERESKEMLRSPVASLPATEREEDTVDKMPSNLLPAFR